MSLVVRPLCAGGGLFLEVLAEMSLWLKQSETNEDTQGCSEQQRVKHAAQQWFQKKSSLSVWWFRDHKIVLFGYCGAKPLSATTPFGSLESSIPNLNSDGKNKDDFCTNAEYLHYPPKDNIVRVCLFCVLVYLKVGFKHLLIRHWLQL